MKKNKYSAKDIITIFSGIIIIAGTICHIINIPYAFIIFGIGALGTSIIRIIDLKHYNNFRLRRLQNIQALSTLLLLATIYLIYAEKTIWILSLLLSACFDLLISFRTPKDKNSI